MRQCPYCGATRAWEWNGERLRDRSKVFVDENGSKWAGRRCPPCERQRVRAALNLTALESRQALAELQARGYQCDSQAFPLRAQKDGVDYRVGLQFASLVQDAVQLEERYIGENCDFYVLVFRSIRIVSQAQWQSLRPTQTSEVPPQEIISANHGKDHADSQVLC
jgi:hypothetical protein